MAGLLPDLRFSPYVAPYVGSANQQYEGVLRQKISDYDVAKSQDDILGYQTDALLQSVAPFDQDKKYALQLQDLYRKRIEDRVNTGNYEDLVTETNRDAKEFLKKITPLQENYKRYNDYLSGIDKEVQEGNIDRETAEATKRYVTSNYQGVDPNNISSTLFRGIQPGKKFDVTSFIDKVGNDWESKKGAIEIETPNGRIIKKKWDQLSPQELAQGFQRALKSNREFQSYAETQGMVGLGPKLLQELNNGLDYGVNKYKKNNIEQGIGYMPKYIYDQMQLDFDYGDPIYGGSGSPSINPMATDESKGKDLFTYYDEAGKEVPALDRYYRTFNAAWSRMVGDENRAVEQEKKIGKPVVSEDIKPLVNKLTTQAQLYNDKLPLSERKPTSYYASQKGQEEVLGNYQKAIENNQEFYNNKKLLREGIPNNLRVGGIDNQVAQNLFGRKVAVKSTKASDIAGLPEGSEEGIDFNALVSKLQDKGYEVDISKAKGNGIDYINFFGNRPSASVTINLKKDKSIIPLELSAEMNEQEGRLFQPMQMVMSAAATGIPNKITLPDGELFDVNMYVNPKTKKFEGEVTHYGPDGKQIQKDISITDFPIYYSKLLRNSVNPQTFNRIFGYRNNRQYGAEGENEVSQSNP
jgi:hypothetical protein